MEIVQISKEELKQIIEKIVRKEIVRVIELIEDILLTPEEKKFLENVKEKIRKKIIRNLYL